MADAVAFKKRKRPNPRTLSPSRDTATPGAAQTSAAGVEGDGIEDNDGLDNSAAHEVDGDQTSETLAELLALRAYRKTTGGIDLLRLNAGEKKSRSSKSSKETAAAAAAAAEAERLEQESSSVVRSNNFTGQTNAVDVDKHMMAYIEAELAKRKGGNATAADLDNVEERAKDPRDELYLIAERWKVAKARTEEGNVQLSTAMLTAIPEVDLGIDIRLKNIEETEKAKRLFYETKPVAAEDSEEFAADRFYRARRPLESDHDALAKARREAVEGHVEDKPKTDKRKQTATDDRTFDRFKKRQQNR